MSFGTLLAQNTLSLTVIGSQGNTASSSNGNSVSYTVGEVIILTSNSTNHILTQGFNQPKSILFNNPLEVYFSISNASCLGISDGNFVIDSVVGCDSNYTITFNGTAATVGDTIYSLASGSYVLDISSGDGCTLFETIEIENVGTDCELTIYNAFSPNGDNTNDLWIIDLVEGYPDNHVSIFDRWGVLSWEGQGYNNADVVWDGKNLSGAELPDGTYFYIFQSNELVLKGYVEITR